jgi:SAM-dependent methyltransferase
MRDLPGPEPAGKSFGHPFDWDLTTADYVLHRSGPPASLYERLRALGIGLEWQSVLDLGTGTGVIARRLAGQGCRVTAIDTARGQIEAARRLALEAGLDVDFRVAPAEDTGLPGGSFDIITANQSWLYFDTTRATAEAKRLLKRGGRLVTSHFCWLPRLDPIARATEEVVLRFNPRWTGADWAGEIPDCPVWAAKDFRVVAKIVHDEAIPFTRESWRGRIRACRGVGTALSGEDVRRFDEAHTELLERIAPEAFTVLHRIDAHVLEALS